MKSCLVIDDDAVNRYVYVAMLDSIGIKVYEADNAVDGLAYYDEYSPDCILLDLMMPKIDGLDFVKLLQDNKKQNQPYIILCTAKKLNSKERKDLLSEGINMVLEKPLRIEGLKGALSEAEIL